MKFSQSADGAVDAGTHSDAVDGSVKRQHNKVPARSRLRSKAWRIAGIYAVFATLWIYFSDQALGLIFTDPVIQLRWSVYKGIAFVLVTSILLLLLILRAFGAIESGYASLRKHKHEIERFNRLYAALSQINQAIVLSSSRESLLQSVSRALVEHGGFAMSWVGWRGGENGPLQCKAASGIGTECIDTIIEQSGQAAPGHTIWEQIFEEGMPVICNDLALEPRSRRWRDQATGNGLFAWAAFPLHEKDHNNKDHNNKDHNNKDHNRKDRIVAVLNVHADETGFFQDKEIALLKEAAFDVSFALNNFVLAEERQQAEDAAKRESDFSDAMVESMPGILYFYDENGHFLRWNRNFETVSGYTHDEIAHMHPLQFFDARDQPLLEARISEVFSKGEATVEATFLSKDGSTQPYFFTGRSIEYDGMKCLVGVGIDISERRRAEDALRELNDTLEIRVVERTQALEAAVFQAEAADRLKSAFLATMSHELRTPLNSIIGFTGIVLQGLAGPLTEEQSKQLGMVRGSARHLLELINDVLDLSKIEAGQLEVKAQAFSLQESIERVVSSVMPGVERKGLNLSTELPPTLPDMKSDRRRVEQILLNLLNNAIKFTDRGSVTLSVAVETHGSDTGTVCIRVRDTGMGIRAADIKSLFQPFRQLDTGLTREHDGTGLGLAICRRLTALLGGEITVNSEWQVGSEFVLRLPLNIGEDT